MAKDVDVEAILTRVKGNVRLELIMSMLITT